MWRDCAAGSVQPASSQILANTLPEPPIVPRAGTRACQGLAAKGGRQIVTSPGALPLLLTLSSGVTGYTTIHAASARQALTRLRFIAQLSDSHQLPVAALNNLVSDAIDLVVHSERGPEGPRVTSILAVEDLTAGADAVQFTTTELFSRTRSDGPLRPTGLLPMRAIERLERAGIDGRELLDGAVTQR